MYFFFFHILQSLTSTVIAAAKYYLTIYSVTLKTVVWKPAQELHAKQKGAGFYANQFLQQVPAFLPACAFIFPNLSPPLALADALQQPRQKPRTEEVRGSLAVPGRGQLSGRTRQTSALWSCSADRQGIKLVLSDSLVYSPNPKEHENRTMFDLIYNCNADV